MEIKLAYSSKIPLEDLVIVFDEERINNLLKHYLSKFDITQNNDWLFIINIIYEHYVFENSPFKRIGVGTKGVTYHKDKEKWMPICISIPNKNEIEWGIGIKQNKITDEAKFSKYYTIDYTKYSNLFDYITDAIIIGIDNLFQNGKIKFN